MRDPQLRQQRAMIPRYRIRARVAVTVKIIGSQGFYEFETENVSRTGLFIQTNDQFHPFNEQSILEIVLKFTADDGGDLSVLAKLIHIQAGKGFGVRIIDLSPEAQRQLSAFIERCEREDPRCRMG